MDQVQGDPDQTGELVSHYRIIRRIGRGGMGDVFAAEDETLKRRVALKTIRAENRPSARDKARFLREARLLSQLDHPGICRIYDYIDGTDRDHLVLELIEGQTLEAEDFSDPLGLIEQLLQVLVSAHEANIIHRDLKPANVMVTPEGVVKVLDLGLARQLNPTEASEATVDLTQAEALLGLGMTFTNFNGIQGTPTFMSPEQASGEPATAASDMYSCGLVMHFLLTGEVAYGDYRHLPDLLDKVRGAATKRLQGCDKHLAELVSELTSRAPGSRPTAAEALRRLRWIRRKPQRRNRRLLAAMLVLLMISGTLKYTLDLRRERQEAQMHRAQAEDLLSFMLGDLKTKLAPISRLDIMNAVASKALEYYSGRDPADLSPADADRYVSTLNLIGQIRLSEGDLDKAATAFTNAWNTAQVFADRLPDSAAWQIQLGATRFYLGNVAYLNDDLDSAEIQFRHYHRIAQALVDRDQHNAVWRKELAYAQTTLAQLFEDQDKPDQAILVLDAALVTKSWLAEQDPEADAPLMDLANSQAIYGSILQHEGRLPGALHRFSQARQNLEIIAARDSLNFEYKARLAVLLQREGRVQAALGHQTEALDLYHRDLAIGQVLVQHDPANARWRRELVTSLLTTGALHATLDESDAARPLLAEASALIRNLPQAADRSRANNDLATARATLALGRGDFAAALTTLQSAPTSTAETCLMRGQALSGLGQNKAARTAWAEGLKLLADKGPAKLSLPQKGGWAQLEFLTGNRAQAELIATELATAGYAASSFRKFCRAHGLANK